MKIESASSADTITSQEVLAQDGPLARMLENFVARPAQQEMAGRIEEVLADGAVFIAESGTGTGKTFAYLVPVLLSGKKVIISTGTKHLQEQLFHRDLPLVRDALGVTVDRALLKGRANYLCLHRLESTELEGRFQSKTQSAEFIAVKSWAGLTRSGDIAEVSGVAEDSSVWPRITSTPESCLGTQCEHYNKCYVVKARKQALDADVLVVNHHLFFADMALKEEGFGQLLPGAEAIIFDEAHQLPEIASNFFSQSFSSRQLFNLGNDIVAEELKERSAIKDLMDTARALDKATADFRLAFDKTPTRDAWQKVSGRDAIRQTGEALKSCLQTLTAQLELAADKGKGLANCYRRASELLDKFYLVSEQPPPDTVAWFETTARGFVLRLTPLDVSTPFRQALEQASRAWVFTSATLAINKKFDHFQQQMGLQEASTAVWDSPFDYQANTLMYLPEGLPDPMHRDYTAKVIDLTVPILKASRGRAFVLFTSYRALKIGAELLPEKVDYPILVQGDAPRSELLETFRRSDNAILLGTGSFWEGVDVQGENLSCVIIDKLPFAPPDDPVMRARGAAMEQAGRNPFMEYQVPTAAIALKQGAGRLIRAEADTGVLVLCDPRLLSKGYGRIFLNSLPPMPRTRALQDVQEFFNARV
ncbi:MAG: ATP-dependent DNA helicase [Gammaproteobacteria bacterium]|nr:ATP-dependent DNA helicase [Gammaproteobacteria bacterium]